MVGIGIRYNPLVVNVGENKVLDKRYKMWYNIDSDLRRLKRSTDELRRKTNKFSGNYGNIDFTYDEQELIRRVISSVMGSFKDKGDVNIAKHILYKTGWIDGK